MAAQGRLSKHLLGAQRSSKVTRPESAPTQHDVSGSCEVKIQHDKFDLQLLRGQMKNLLDQVGSLKRILKGQSDEIHRLRSANDELANADRRLSYTQKKYQAAKLQNEEMKKNLALEALQNNALRAEVANLRDQLEKMSQMVKEKESRIFEMVHPHKSLPKKNEDLSAQELTKLYAAKENRISELENKQLSLVKKNEDMLAEIAKLRREMCNVEKMLLIEQDSRKDGQQHLLKDLQLARSSLLQKHDILSDEVAHLRNKLDSSVSFAISSDTYNQMVATKNSTINDNESIGTSHQGVAMKNPTVNDYESIDELSVDTIRDVEGLRRALGKLLPSCRQFLGDTPIGSANEVISASSQSSKEKPDSHNNSSAKGKEANDEHLKLTQVDVKYQRGMAQRQITTQDVTSLKSAKNFPEHKNRLKENDAKCKNWSSIAISKVQDDPSRSSKGHEGIVDTHGIFDVKKKPLESSSFTGVEIFNAFQTELPIKDGRDREQQRTEQRRAGKEQIMPKLSSSEINENGFNITKVKDRAGGEDGKKLKGGERTAIAKHISQTTLPHNSKDTLMLVQLKDHERRHSGVEFIPNAEAHQETKKSIPKSVKGENELTSRRMQEDMIHLSDSNQHVVQKMKSHYGANGDVKDPLEKCFDESSSPPNLEGEITLQTESSAKFTSLEKNEDRMSKLDGPNNKFLEISGGFAPLVDQVNVKHYKSNISVERLTPAVESEDEESQIANDLTPKNVHRESWGDAVESGRISRKMRSDSFPIYDSNKWIGQENPYFDRTCNDKKSEDILSSESPSPLGSKAAKLMQMGPNEQYPSNEYTLWERNEGRMEDLGSSFAEMLPNAFEVNNESGQNDNDLTPARKLSQASSSSLEELQNNCKFGRDVTDNTAAHEGFEAISQYNDEIYLNTPSDVLSETARKFENDGKQRDMDALSLIEEEISVNESDSVVSLQAVEY